MQTTRKMHIDATMSDQNMSYQIKIQNCGNNQKYDLT